MAYRLPMSNDMQVLADGAERGVSPRRPPSPWAILAVCLVLGMGFIAVSLFSPEGEEAPVESTSPQLERPVGDVRAEEFGLGEVVQGFQDALVGVATNGEDTVVHVLWPRGRSAVERDTVGGDDVRFDRSGSHIAVTTVASGGSDLAVGRPNAVRPVASNVTSSIWHDSLSGQLSYTTVEDGVWRLFKLTSGFSPREVVNAPGDEGRVAAWGDWGFAIQGGEGVTLLNKEGQFKATHPGIAYASTDDGWLFMAGEHLDLVSAGGGVVRLDVSSERMGLVHAASFSPDGELLAIAGTNGVLVLPVRGDGEIREIVADDPSRMVWTGDSRFLVIPAETGVSIIDLDTVNRYLVLEGYVFQSVGVIPTGAP